MASRPQAHEQEQSEEAPLTKLDQLIAETEDLVVRYRCAGMPIDAAAARIRLQALRDAKAALQS